MSRDPTQERRFRESRTLLTSKPWRLAAKTHMPDHDTPSPKGRRLAAEVSPVERPSQPPPVVYFFIFDKEMIEYEL